jgi:hypothetical protein
MAILKLRAMRGWNKSETSRHFLVSDDMTLAAAMHGPPRIPLNKNTR